MSAANRSRFVYVTYIRTTPEELWKALTDPQLMRRYWSGFSVQCGWKKGSAWKMVQPDGRVADMGEILEIDPPRRVVIRWQNEWKPELKAEGPSRCTLEIERVDGAVVKLTVSHEMDRPDSKFIAAVSGGWPHILANLKTLLETGRALQEQVECSTKE